MTNSMNDLYNEIKAALKPESMEKPMESQIAAVVKAESVHGALSWLRNRGFDQLCILTCVDWIDDGQFELVYVLFGWTEGVHVQLRARLDRENPVFVTVTDIFPGAQYYEREVHEFFGVEFEGNEMSYKPLFLEKWESIPPLRKDFDPQEYSDSKFPMKDRDKVFKSKIGGVQ